MKIAFVSDQFFPRTSADSEQIISSLSALSNKAEVSLISAKYKLRDRVLKSDLENYYGRSCNFKLEFIEHSFKNVRGFEKLSFALRSGMKLKQSDYELVYTRNIPVVIAVLMFSNKNVLFESYRPWPKRNILAKWFFSKLSRINRFLGVVLHSNFAKESYIDVGFDDTKLLVAHNAFDFSLYPETERRTIRKEFGLPQNKIITTYSGRVTKEKGLLRLLNLAELYKKHFFLIIGSENFGEIEKKAENLSNVKVLGWLDRKTVFSLLKSSDILYIPPTLVAREVSKNTVLPIKTFIYKASGVAVFGPAVSDIEEVLTHKENSYLVKPDDSESEVNGFGELVEDIELRKQLGKKAQSEMKLNTWDSRAIKINSFIHQRFSTQSDA